LEHPYTGAINILEAFDNVDAEESYEAGILTAPYVQAPNTQWQSKSHQFSTNVDPDCCWRVYSLEWTLGRMEFKLDDVTVYVADNYFPSQDMKKNTLADFPEPFTGDWYLNLFLVVGGPSQAAPPQESEFQSLQRRTFQIDYIRSYKCV